MDKDLTTCINQLAERAEELGEKNTATVLYTLTAHRIVNADIAMALVAKEQAQLLKAVCETLNPNLKDKENL